MPYLTAILQNRSSQSIIQGVPKVLVWNFNFKKNIAVNLLHFCSFESLFSFFMMYNSPNLET